LGLGVEVKIKQKSPTELFREEIDVGIIDNIKNLNGFYERVNYIY